MSIQNVEMFETVMMFLFVIRIQFSFMSIVHLPKTFRAVRIQCDSMESIHTNISKACSKVYNNLHIYSV